MSDLIGQTIDRYQILEQLGQGGMATVYLAYDMRLDRKVAVKVIRRDAFPPAMLEKILKRFEREAKALARLNHPNIVGVIDYGTFNGTPYIVMPFIPSGTLKEKLGKPLHYSEAAQILLPIAKALAYAHEEDIIHRDVKPSNILITRSGEPVLTDFGIAKILEEVDGGTLTSTGMGLGTPEYMAPEQWQGKADPGSDQYAIGVIFYEMVTGQKPFTADTPVEVMLKQATEPLPNPSQLVPDFPEQIEFLILKMMAKNSKNRYQSMTAVVKAMENIIHSKNGGNEEQIKDADRNSIIKEIDGKETTPHLEISYDTMIVEENNNKKESKKAESIIAEKNVEPNENKIYLPLETKKLRSDHQQNQEKPNNKKLNKKLIWTFSGIGLLAIVFWIMTMAIKQSPISLLQPNNPELDPTTITLSSISAPDSTLPIMSLSSTPIEENVIQKISKVDEMELLYVPEGIFLMGDESESAYTNEKPVHEVYLDAFWIDKYEISNKQYRLCVESGNCSMPKTEEFLNLLKNEKQPVINITWLQAKEYCNWAERDLPTEAQWEKAARGPNAQIYPWGDLQPDIKIANFNNHIRKSTMAGNYPDGVSYYGLYDMAGNVWEWVNDWYSKNYYSSQTEWNNPEGPDSIQLKVIRGGSWNSPTLHLRTSYRTWYIFDSSNFDIGFRCAMDADQ